MYLVSACLAGFNTRYDGTHCLEERVRRLVFSGQAVPVCPEQLGGLPTPRPPLEFTAGAGAEALDGKTGVHVVDNQPLPSRDNQPLPSPHPSPTGRGRNPVEDGGAEGEGVDYTAALLRGARETLRIARLYGIKEAILKDGSPSCGTSHVHTGGHEAKGQGVTAELLAREGFKVRGVDSLQG
ncbi:MAG: DUF523 domain-containing protein [Nitrospiraceae bacterium]|nr:DUF523 domain-containing protein [Nitrospiraceae bacterium]